MPRRKSDEPRLCPDCPRIGFLHLVKRKSWTRTPAIETNLKTCAKLRALKLSEALQCPYYSKSERIDFWGRKKRRRK